MVQDIIKNKTRARFMIAILTNKNYVDSVLLTNKTKKLTKKKDQSFKN